MSYKVAVASTDGKVVNEHFGRCKNFAIFKIDEEGAISFLERRECEPLCQGGEHKENHMGRNVALVEDCRAVLVSKIGPNAEMRLRAKGIDVFVIGDFIENALQKLHMYYKTAKSGH